MYVDTWYDRHTRSWVVQLKDRDGNQIGDAEYVGNTHDRDRIVNMMQAQTGAEIKSRK